MTLKYNETARSKCYGMIYLQFEASIQLVLPLASWKPKILWRELPIAKKTERKSYHTSYGKTIGCHALDS